MSDTDHGQTDDDQCAMKVIDKVSCLNIASDSKKFFI